MCGRIIFGLTRSVVENYDPNDNESNPELFSLNLRERTGFIPMRILFSKSMATNKSLEVGLYWSGKADKCVLSRGST